MKSLPLEFQFASQRLLRFLRKNPHEAQPLAVTYFEDFLLLTQKHKKLQKDFERMQMELINLKSQSIPLKSKSLSLTDFLSRL